MVMNLLELSVKKNLKNSQKPFINKPCTNKALQKINLTLSGKVMRINLIAGNDKKDIAILNKLFSRTTQSQQKQIKS